MKPKKRLKELTLKKEAIVNLNDYEMGQVEGGSSWGCSISISILSVEITYDITKSNWWMCEVPQPTKHIIHIGDQPSCLIDEVDIVALDPNKP
jgi:hypothetical protein